MENHGLIALLKRLTALTACEKQTLMDANTSLGIVFRRWITQLSNQWVSLSLRDLSELVMARVTWTEDIQ